MRGREGVKCTPPLYTSETTRGCTEFPPPVPENVQCMNFRKNGECLSPAIGPWEEALSYERGKTQAELGVLARSPLYVHAHQGLQGYLAHKNLPPPPGSP
jgi:hypothetical protein